MKKLILLMLFVTSCAYKPVIDTAGKSGTFAEDKAKEISNDLHHCKTLAKDNTNNLIEGGKYVWNYYIRPSVLWLAPKVEYSYPQMYRTCVQNRGHSVLN